MNQGFWLVCVNKKKTGLPVNIWLNYMTRNENKIFFQNNYSYEISSEKSLIPIVITEDGQIVNTASKTKVKNNDIQIVLKYISDNVKIFLKYFNGEIDDLDTLNLLYGGKCEN